MKRTNKLSLIILVLCIAGVGIGFLLISGKWNILTTDWYVASVNKNLTALRKVNVTIYAVPDTPAETDAYEKKEEVVKIATTFFGDKVHTEREYYYQGRRLRFVHEKVNSYDETAKDYLPTEENWFYFDKGKMITWLAGAKKELKGRNKEYFLQEEDILSVEQDLLTGLSPRLAWKQINSIPLASFLPGNVFRCSFEAGEEGVFEEGGTLRARLIQEFPSDGNTSRVGSWRLEGEKLILSGTNLSDNTFTDFVFQEKDGLIIAEPKAGTCGMTIAKDLATIDQYEDAHVYIFGSSSEDLLYNEADIYPQE